MTHFQFIMYIYGMMIAYLNMMGHFVDRCWYLDRYEVWNHGIRDLDAGNSGLDPSFHMFICCRICMVMGSIRMVSAK